MAIFETIKYKVLEKHGHIELREYDDILFATTKTSMNQSQDSGFSNVFGYISGNNDTQEKISMTTPVVTYEDSDELVTGFYVPSKFNKETLPRPKSPKVFIEEMKKSIYAVIKFRGRWREENYIKHDLRLQSFIEDQDYQIDSPRMLFRYQPPFVPSVLRRNELAYKIIKKKITV